ncbi:MAG: hypothetical protein P8Z78_02595 [Gammaproteobacteria bacterium]
MKRLPLLLLLALFMSTSAAADAVERLRSWAHAQLTAELQKERPNMNMLASLSLPLVTDVQRNSDAGSMALIERIVRNITAVPVEERQCGELAAVHLVSRFFDRVERGFTSRDFLERLEECFPAETLFDLTSALIFYCGHTQLDAGKQVPGGLERLLGAQQADGIFMPEEGEAWYYLTSHALLAMHYCKADAQKLELTRGAIERHLPQFQKTEFIDGLAESLIYLRWTGKPARGEAGYTGYLRGRVAQDGGVCFRHARGCEKHWHPVGRVWQLLLEVE